MRGNLMGELPRKMSLNGAIPLLLNIKVGSPFTTMGALGTIWWPLLLKKSRNVWRTKFDSINLKIRCQRTFQSAAYEMKFTRLQGINPYQNRICRAIIYLTMTTFLADRL